MAKINLIDFQKRKLKKCYLAIYVVEKEINIRTDTCITSKTLYVLWGVDIVGNRQIIGMYFNDEKDNRFWLEKFEDIQARNVEKILFFVTPLNKNIERCLKIVYNDTKIIRSPDCIVSSITQFWADKPSRKAQIALKSLFLADNFEKYKLELQMFKEVYIDNKLITFLIDKKQDEINKFYEYNKHLRSLFYPYYTIREMKKSLNKIKTKEPLCTNINEVIEFCIDYINSFENGRIYSKAEWLDLISIIYDDYEGELEEYING